jgi:phosphonate transport system substrate-binding protein
MNKIFCAMLSAWLWLGMGAIQAQAQVPEAQKQLTIGIVPQQSATRLAEDWGPVLTELSRRSGVTLVFRTAPSIPAFEERLGKGDYDLAYMNPYHYVVFHKAAGYVAFAKEQDRRLKGILVVKKDSTYRVPADLAGKTVVFPAPAAFAASILPQAEFGRLKIPIEAKFVASHDSVYRAVASGLQEAGGGIQRTLEASPVEVRNALRVLTETPAYTPHAFAAHPRVAPAVLAKVLAAMVSLSGDAAGRELLVPLAFKGLAAAQDKEWNDIRALDIDLLQRYSRE